MQTRWRARSTGASFLCVGWLLCCPCSPVLGVVINVGDGSGNTTAPADDPGFANAGLRGAGSAVYLGNRWVLTAAHVGAGPVTFEDRTFQNVVDETHRLTNPNGRSQLTDLVLFRLVEEPDLPAVRLGCDAISGGTDVVMVGYGRDRDEDLSFWSVEVFGGDNNDVWTSAESKVEAESKGLLAEEGFQTQDSRTLRWGKNRVAVVDIDAESGFGDVLSFQTIFHPIVAVDHLGQGIKGDSGGPVFQKHDGVWELVGLMHAITLKDNQPGRSSTALFGNETFSADLYAYSDTIRAIADFEPESGDIDGDGVFTAVDIDRMLSAIRDPVHNSCHFDLNGDSKVGNDDRDILLGKSGGLVGDVDLNGKVEFTDFIELARAFGDVDTGWARGDFDGDGQTAFPDFLALADSFGGSSASRSRTRRGAAAVPEPSSFCLVLAASFMVLALRRRR